MATLIPFDSEEEVARAAPTACAMAWRRRVWTRDLSGRTASARALESGIVWVNTWMLRDLRTPFGGMKDSGVGREGGHEALRFFTEPKNVCIHLQGG